MEPYDVIVNQPVVIDNVNTHSNLPRDSFKLLLIIGYWCNQSRLCRRPNSEM